MIYDKCQKWHTYLTADGTIQHRPCNQLSCPACQKRLRALHASNVASYLDPDRPLYVFEDAGSPGAHARLRQNIARAGENYLRTPRSDPSQPALMFSHYPAEGAEIVEGDVGDWEDRIYEAFMDCPVGQNCSASRGWKFARARLEPSERQEQGPNERLTWKVGVAWEDFLQISEDLGVVVGEKKVEMPEYGSWLWERWADEVRLVDLRPKNVRMDELIEQVGCFAHLFAA